MERIREPRTNPETDPLPSGRPRRGPIFSSRCVGIRSGGSDWAAESINTIANNFDPDFDTVPLPPNASR